MGIPVRPRSVEEGPASGAAIQQKTSGTPQTPAVHTTLVPPETHTEHPPIQEALPDGWLPGMYWWNRICLSEKCSKRMRQQTREGAVQ